MKLCYVKRFYFDQIISFFEEKQNGSACKFEMSDWKEVLCGLSDPDVPVIWKNTAASLPELVSRCSVVLLLTWRKGFCFSDTVVTIFLFLHIFNVTSGSKMKMYSIVTKIIYNRLQFFSIIHLLWIKLVWWMFFLQICTMEGWFMVTVIVTVL